MLGRVVLPRPREYEVCVALRVGEGTGGRLDLLLQPHL